MTLRLVIEHAAHPQRERERLHPGGEFSIGRGAECSWQLDDPDQFVSRKHCVISGGPGRWLVTDASRGGLFIDGADRALGPGNSAALENGMRLRLGDVVLRVEVMDAAAAAPRAASPRPATQSLGGDGFFSTPIVAPAPMQRPAGLPQPFDAPSAAMVLPPVPDRPAPPPMFDDPFTLDPVATPPRLAAPAPQRPAPLFADPFSEPAHDRRAEPSQPGYDGGFGDFFGDTLPASADAAAVVWPEPAPPAISAQTKGGFDDWGLPPVMGAPTPDALPPPLSPEPIRSRERVPPLVEPSAPPLIVVAVPEPSPPPPALLAQPTPVPYNPALTEAFFRGLGIPGADTATPDQMEALGKRYRMLVEGVINMLRTRAREKQNVRVAQTIIGSADVNPLKFIANTDDALAAVIAPRGPGYLPPDAAIAAAFRDLADHQVRTWTGMQSALRQMIDRFDPGMIEAEIETAGLVKSLLAGGRNAKLWQLYTDRYKDIARSAEDRFLGEVGADFRDAYEGNRRKSDDPQT